MVWQVNQQIHLWIVWLLFVNFDTILTKEEATPIEKLEKSCSVHNFLTESKVALLGSEDEDQGREP